MLRRAMLAAAVLAFAQPALAVLVGDARAATMTDVGTPREETLIVEHLAGRLGNPTQMNPYQEGLQMGEGLRQIAYSQLWDIDTSTGRQSRTARTSPPW